MSDSGLDSDSDIRCTEPTNACSPCDGPRVLSFDVGVRNLSYCLLASPSPPKKSGLDIDTRISAWSVYDWGCADILDEAGSKAKKVYSVKATTLIRYLLQYLHKKFGALFDSGLPAPKLAVLVEDQPRGSKKMKMISYAIVTYFETRAVMNDWKIPIDTVSPKEKLGLCDQLDVETEKPARILKTPAKPKPTPKPKVVKTVPTTKQLKERAKGKRYRNNKWRAVQGCKMAMEMVVIDQTNKDVFNSSKKKDDIADAFMQGLWYCTKKK